MLTLKFNGVCLIWLTYYVNLYFQVWNKLIKCIVSRFADVIIIESVCFMCEFFQFGMRAGSSGFNSLMGEPKNM
jgi:hypothetical protein